MWHIFSQRDILSTDWRCSKCIYVKYILKLSVKSEKDGTRRYTGLQGGHEIQFSSKFGVQLSVCPVLSFFWTLSTNHSYSYVYCNYKCFFFLFCAMGLTLISPSHTKPLVFPMLFNRSFYYITRYWGSASI
jgi:hypothetical protein